AGDGAAGLVGDAAVGMQFHAVEIAVDAASIHDRADGPSDQDALVAIAVDQAAGLVGDRAAGVHVDAGAVSLEQATIHDRGRGILGIDGIVVAILGPL